MLGPRRDDLEVGRVVEDIVNNLQAMEDAMIYADPDIMAATTTRCLHHGRPDKYVPLSLDPACPRAGELVRCLGCITRDVSAELAHPVLKKATAVAKRKLGAWGILTRSTPYSAGWNGEWRHPAPGGWDSLPPASAPPFPASDGEADDPLGEDAMGWDGTDGWDGWDGRTRGGWDSPPPAIAPPPCVSEDSLGSGLGFVDATDPHYDGDGGYDSDPFAANMRSLGRDVGGNMLAGWGDDY